MWIFKVRFRCLLPFLDDMFPSFISDPRCPWASWCSRELVRARERALTSVRYRANVARIRKMYEPVRWKHVKRYNFATNSPGLHNHVFAPLGIYNARTRIMPITSGFGIRRAGDLKPLTRMRQVHVWVEASGGASEPARGVWLWGSDACWRSKRADRRGSSQTDQWAWNMPLELP